MKYVFTAIFSPEPGNDDIYNVSFPDIPSCNTFGNGLSEAIDMAEDALCLVLYHLEQENEKIPIATPPNKVHTKGDNFTSAISVDTEYYRRYYENKLVKKTLNIPMWLNQRAEDANVNFSQILQKGLKEFLHISESASGNG